MDRDYNTALAGLRFSDEAKQRMAHAVAAAASHGEEAPTSQTAAGGQQAAHRPRFAHRFAIAAAIAATLILGMGGIAVASGNAMSLIAAVDDLFKGAPARTEIVDAIGRPVDAAATANGLTVTADAVIGDRENCLVVFSISKADGSGFDVEPNENGLLPLAFQTSNVEIAGVTSAIGTSYFYDSDPDDDTVQFVISHSAQSLFGSIIGGTAHVSLENLVAYGEGYTESTSVAEGTWNLDFKLAYDDTSLDLAPGQSFELNGMQATVNAITVSPIAVTLDYTVPGTIESGGASSGKMPEELQQQFDAYLGVPVTVTLDDGSTFDFLNTGGLAKADGDAETCHVNIAFGRILDLESIASVTIGGTEIALP